MKQLIKTIVAIATFAFALSILDWSALASAMARTSPAHLAIMFVIDLLAYIVLTLRWVIILGDRTSADRKRIVRSYLYSTMLNLITPASLGGDVYRFCALTEGAPLERPYVLGALFKERLLGLLGIILAFILSWGLWRLRLQTLAPAGIQTMNSMGAIFLVAVPSAACVLWLVSKGWLRLPEWFGGTAKRWADGIVQALVFPTATNAVVLVLLSVLAAFSWIAPVVYYAMALGANLPWSVVSMITVLVALAVILPISIQGVGVREGLFAALFALCGSQSEIGFAVGAVSYLVLGVAMLAIGLTGLVAERLVKA